MNHYSQPLSVIVPTLNEAENLDLLFERIDKALSRAKINYEIVIVDDHSSDDTVSVADNAKAHFPIRTFMKAGKRGKAYSLLEGFQHAQYDLVCMIDADLQYPPEAIVEMYRLLSDTAADVVITERIEQQTSFLRRAVSKSFNLVFTQFLFGIHYDTQSGLKLFRKAILKDMTLTPSPWSFDLEFIVRSLENNYKIVNYVIPFSARNAGKPKIHVLAASFELGKASLKLRKATSLRRVRHSYKQNLAYTRGGIFLLGLLAVIVFSGLANIATPAVSAISISSVLNSSEQAVDSTVSAAVKTITKSNRTTTTTPSTITAPPATSNVESTPAASSSTTAASTVPATAPVSTNSTASTLPSSTSTSVTNSPKPTSPPANPPASIPASTSISAGSKAASATSAASAVSNPPSSTSSAAATPVQAQADLDSFKPASYYKSATVNPALTTAARNIAFRVLLIGFVLIGLSIISLSVRIKMKHRTIPAIQE